jgi:hypothetical protein
MAVVMGGAIAAVAVTIMDGGAVVIAAGIKIHTQRGRLGWRPLSCQNVIFSLLIFLMPGGGGIAVPFRCWPAVKEAVA